MSTIGIDVDGVLANFCFGYAALVTAETGIQFPLDDPLFPYEWYWERAAGVTKEQETKVWSAIKASENFWSDLDSLHGAEMFLQWLSTSVTHDVYFITHRMGTDVKFQTETWLMANGYTDIPTVLVSPAKGALCKALGCQFYIDDKHENCLDVLTQSPDTKTFVRETSYNQVIEGAAGRGSLEDFAKLINEG